MVEFDREVATHIDRAVLIGQLKGIGFSRVDRCVESVRLVDGELTRFDLQMPSGYSVPFRVAANKKIYFSIVDISAGCGVRVGVAVVHLIELLCRNFMDLTVAWVGDL